MITTRIREVKPIKKAQGKFTGGKAGLGYEVIDGVKVAKNEEQKVISEMRRIKTLENSYSDIASWLKANTNLAISFMGTKNLLATN